MLGQVDGVDAELLGVPVGDRSHRPWFLDDPPGDANFPMAMQRVGPGDRHLRTWAMLAACVARRRAVEPDAAGYRRSVRVEPGCRVPASARRPEQ